MPSTSITFTKTLIITLAITLFNSIKTHAQFPGPVGTEGTTAIHKDSNIFVNWAVMCNITRGPQNISIPNSAETMVGDSSAGIGKAGVNGVVSLGDGGSAILTFENPITNGSGFDFAVFENSFSDDFLELAFVEVSSDGINYFRFPATSNTQTAQQIGPFDNTGDARKIHNLAGKYRVNYGTPFDLDDLKMHTDLDINAITHVKIIDVIGSINPQYATYDSNNNPINDPFPTDFASGGFDLDVIHEMKNTSIVKYFSKNISLYPNPALSFITVNLTTETIKSVEILNTNNYTIEYHNQPHIKIEHLTPGLYLIKVIGTSGNTYTSKFIKQ
jgi:hypothetical protein